MSCLPSEIYKQSTKIKVERNAAWELHCFMLYQSTFPHHTHWLSVLGSCEWSNRFKKKKIQSYQKLIQSSNSSVTLISSVGNNKGYFNQRWYHYRLEPSQISKGIDKLQLKEEGSIIEKCRDSCSDQSSSSYLHLHPFRYFYPALFSTSPLAKDYKQNWSNRIQAVLC